MAKGFISKYKEKRNEVKTFQVRTIAKERLISKTGEITGAQLEILKNGLQEILTY
ncbi:MAG: type II toxin-antitoxin system PemK/MazF family toxin [Bacteroidales bacterium]|jgi:mRNA-degrading endonuclease toxin of MazEF toxin-antitoxin module|nr:type II toxin-antitoxin system PemK/MazF family toxin [Bacteroidales bacterium]